MQTLPTSSIPLGMKGVLQVNSLSLRQQFLVLVQGSPSLRHRHRLFSQIRVQQSLSFSQRLALADPSPHGPSTDTRAAAPLAATRPVAVAARSATTPFSPRRRLAS